MKTISFSPPDIEIEEIKEVVETLKSGWITTGPRTKQFEKEIAEYCGVNKAVCLNSATACLELILRLLGVGSGDEVITTAYTYTASASPVCHIGAKLVLVDVAKDSYEMDYEKLADAITEKTKVIIPVDLGGVLCNYNKIFSIVEQRKKLFHPSNNLQEKYGRIIVVADSAHAFGAKVLMNGQWKRSGSLADFTSFSFHAVKNLTTAEGGALVWNKIDGIDDEWIYNQFMYLSLHGQSKDALRKNQLGMWEYDIVTTGYKCNMTDIMAAIGLKQLERYENILKRRKEIINKYDMKLKSLDLQILDHYSKNSYSSGHLYLTRIKGIDESERNAIIKKLAEFGIATNVHYKPLPLLTAYKKMGFHIEDYINAYMQYQNEITLPLHTCLRDEEIEYIIERIFDILK